MISNFYMENWDLQAVVGESSNEYACISGMEKPAFSFDPWSFQQDEDLMSFPEVFETNHSVFDELGELYKPFYPALNPYSTQTIITGSLPVLQDRVEEPENQKQQQSDSQSAPSGTNKESAKPKKSSRKNQQNRVVKHVTADDLPSDRWSWRKYGQKPIKGSPYPRSYYRCSSSKGCLARKQVERSCSDPRMFIITYTAEHSHDGHPTRRNSLAGCTRNKSSIVPKNLANKNDPHEAEETAVSPTTNLKVTIKDEPVKQESIKMEELQQMIEDVDQIQGDKILTPNVMLSDELDQSLENFEGFFLDQFPDLSHELWSMNESAPLTGGLLN